MPETYGKRMRKDSQARKAAAREERRVARAHRRELREQGLIEAGTPVEATPDEDLGLAPVAPAEDESES